MREATAPLETGYLVDGVGEQFKFDEAVSFQINCEAQDEIDYYWERLSEGGEEGPCGWLKDRYGLSWQVTPTGMEELFADPDPERARRAMEVMLPSYRPASSRVRSVADAALAPRSATIRS
jgi:predicted 3-demethylubiquinone-9 3-methyltransferase (glyoxalase superfamily)